jgi:hypothetical protein
MNKKSGEIVTGLLIGLAVGLASLWVVAHNDAVTRSNATNAPADRFDYVRENPGRSTVIVAAPTAAGLGIGWLVESLKDGGSSGNRNNDIVVNDNRGNVSISIRGDGGDSTSSSTRTDTRTETRD